VRLSFLLGRILWLTPDHIEGRRLVQNGVHHAVRSMLLPDNALRVENAGATYEWMMRKCLGEQTAKIFKSTSMMW
jgi:hypothetical protein